MAFFFLVLCQFVADVWYRKASHVKEKPTIARTYLLKSIRWDPGNEVAHAAIGASYQQQAAKAHSSTDPQEIDYLEKAHEAYSTAIHHAPTESSNHMNLGWVRYQMAQLRGLPPGQTVLDSFVLASRLDPNNYYTHYLLGTYFLAHDAVAAACAAFRKSIEALPLDQVIQTVLSTAIRKTTAYEDLVQIIPEHVPLAHYYFAMVLEDTFKDWTHAAIELKKAMDLSPGTRYFRDYYFMLALRHRDVKAAEEEIRVRSTLFGPQPSLHAALARFFMEEGAYEKALEVCTRLEHIDPASPELDPLRAEIKRRQGNLLEALSAYQQAIEKNPSEANNYFHLARLHSDHGKPYDAARLLSKAVALDPTNSRYREALGDIYLLVGMKSQAEEAFLASTQLDAGSVQPWLKLGDLYMEQEKWIDAAQAFAKALKIDPRNDTALQGFLKAHARIR